jgi:hypothetical protein
MSVEWVKPKKSIGNRRAKVPFVSIANRDNSKIYFNSKVVRDILNNNRFIKIGIDAIKKRMYFKETTVNDIDSLRLVISNGGGTGTINISRITRKVVNVAGINKGDLQRYEVKQLEGNTYYADFTKPLDNMKGEIVNDWE